MVTLVVIGSFALKTIPQVVSKQLSALSSDICALLRWIFLILDLPAQRINLVFYFSLLYNNILKVKLLYLERTVYQNILGYFCLNVHWIANSYDVKKNLGTFLGKRCQLICSFFCGKILCKLEEPYGRNFPIFVTFLKNRT